MILYLCATSDKYAQIALPSYCCRGMHAIYIQHIALDYKGSIAIPLPPFFPSFQMGICSQ